MNPNALKIILVIGLLLLTGCQPTAWPGDSNPALDEENQQVSIDTSAAISTASGEAAGEATPTSSNDTAITTSATSANSSADSSAVISADPSAVTSESPSVGTEIPTATRTTSPTTPQSTQKEPPINTEDVNSVRFSEVLGDVLFVKGANTQWFQAIPGMQLNLKDTLATKADSEADLDVDEDKHVLVGEEVRMVVDRLLKEVGKSKATALRVDSGVAYVRIQRKLGQDESFEVITPTSVMGVRGTHFVVEVIGGDTAISVIEGSVEGQLIKRYDPDAPVLSESARAKAQNLMPKFTIGANQRLIIPLGSQKAKDWIAGPLTPSMLPPVVLKHIQKDSSRLPATYGRPLADAISTAIAISKVNSSDLGAERYKLSGARYIDPLTGRVYARVDRGLTFSEAAEWSRIRGGHLLTITNAAEQRIATQLVEQGKLPYYLIGLLPKADASWGASTFEWVTKELYKYENWLDQTSAQSAAKNLQTQQASKNVVLTNQVGKPKGLWTLQVLSEIDGNYGFICEWSKISDVRIPESDALAPIAGVNILNSDGTMEILAPGQPLPAGAVLIFGVEPVVAPVVLNWKTATAKLYPFAMRQMTYDVFLNQKLGDSIEGLIRVLGISEKLETADSFKWTYIVDDRELSATTRDGKILLISQKNLAQALTKQELSAASIQERLNNYSTTSEVDGFLAVNGIVERKEQRDGKSQWTTWVWKDARGLVFAVVADESSKIISREFRGFK